MTLPVDYKVLGIIKIMVKIADFHCMLLLPAVTHSLSLRWLESLKYERFLLNA